MCVSVCVFLVLFRILSLLSDVRTVGKLHIYAAKNKMLTETRIQDEAIELESAAQRLLHGHSSCSWQLQSYVAIRKVSSVIVAFRQCLLQRGHLALNLLLKEKYHCLLILLELKMNSELALI